jgi:hypothetical protein
MRSLVERIWAFVCFVFVVSALVLPLGLTSCKTSGKSDTGTGPATTESTSEAVQPVTAGDSDTPTETAPTESSAPAPEKTGADETAPASPSSSVSAENSVKDNVQLVIALQKAASLEAAQKAVFDAAVLELVTLYDGKDLERQDQLELCTRLPTFLAAVKADPGNYAGAAAQHCDKYLDGTPEFERKTMAFRSALFTSASSHTASGNHDAAEELYRVFLRTFCDVENDPSNARNTPGCRRILTQFLPRIYHEKGDAAMLEALLDECALYQIERDSDLREVRKYLLTDLWSIERFDTLEAICKTVLELNVWGEFSNPSRELIPLALSSQSRVRGVKKDCYAARQTYLDYEFYHTDIDATWLNDHVTVPSRLLCRPAPALSENIQWLGKAPGSGKVKILHFATAYSAQDIAHVGQASDQLSGIPGVSVSTLIPSTGRIFDPSTGQVKSGLSSGDFQAAAKALFGDAKQAVGILKGGREDPTITRFGVKHYPTTVMIGPDGTVAAYNTAAELDPGWAVLAKTLTK